MTTKYYKHQTGFSPEISYSKIVDGKEAWFVLKRGGRKAYDLYWADWAVDNGHWIEIPKPLRIRNKKSANKRPAQKTRYYRSGKAKWFVTDYVKVEDGKVLCVGYDGKVDDLTSAYLDDKIERLIRQGLLREIVSPESKLMKFKVQIFNTFSSIIEVEAEDSTSAIKKAMKSADNNSDWKRDGYSGKIIS